MPNCKQCKTGFEFSQEERNLLRKMDPAIGDVTFEIPDPTLCPICRLQRRTLLRNEYEYYKRSSDLSGKPMVSMYSPDAKGKIYAFDEWWSDSWEGTDYGREYDFSRPFFEQFAELFAEVPRINLLQDGTSENCDYTNYGSQNKNCYLSQALYCEDIYYSNAIKSKDSVDCYLITNCERTYEAIDSDKCYASAYLQNCTQCSDSYFLENCTNCQNCLGSKNLKNKRYYIFNEQYSKEEYFERLKEFKLNTHSGREAFKEKFKAFSLTLPNRFREERLTENSVGNYLDGAKNCKNCFDVVAGAENCINGQLIGLKADHLLDCDSTAGHYCYDSNGIMNGNLNHWTHFARESSDIMYCLYIYNGKNLFGCTGLRNKQYCILNKQYSKEEYEDLVPKIIEHMRSTGEWGEFFPASLNLFGYNETFAQILFPLSKDQALQQGFTWNDYEAPNEVVKSVEADRLPDDISDVPDDILNWAVVCEETGKLFKIIPQELKFYREMQIPIPRRSPRQRHKDRYNKRNPYYLWDRKCDKCQIDIQTTYSPDRPEKVYCEHCYLKEVY